MDNFIDYTELINVVKEFPELYDSTENEFKNNSKKRNAWNNIARLLQAETNECKKYWRTLRERYTRELRKQILDLDYKSHWEYFDKMHFLSEHIKFRNAEANSILQNGNASISSIIKSEDSNTETWPLEQADTSVDEEADDESEITNLGTEYSNINFPLSTAASRAELLKNEDDAFCVSVAFSLAKLSRAYNLRAKLEIFQIVEKYQKLQEQNKT